MDVNNVNKVETTPLIDLSVIAGAKGSFEVLSLLLENGAKINFQTANEKTTALHKVAEFCHLEKNMDVYNFLVSQGADEFLQNVYGETARSIMENNVKKL